MMADDRSPERSAVVHRLHEDLIGPRQAKEVLTARPTDVYLAGILWPARTAMSGEDDDRLGLAVQGGADTGEDSEEGAVSIGSIQKPSVAGISFNFSSDGPGQVRAVCSFGRYLLWQDPETRAREWRRVPVVVAVPAIDLTPGTRRLNLADFEPAADGVQLHVRSITGNGQRLATISIVNLVEAPEGRDGLEQSALFQTVMRLEPCDGTNLTPRPPRKPTAVAEDVVDENAATLLFRNEHVFAVGHTCSATWEPSADATDLSAKWIETTWLPSAFVPGTSSSGHRAFRALNTPVGGIDPLSAKDLSRADDSQLSAALKRLCDCYGDWLTGQQDEVENLSDENLRTIAKRHLKACVDVLARLRSAVKAIGGDPHLLQAFRLANLAMHVQHGWDPEKSAKGTLRWRPFQLAFLLLSTPSAVDRKHADRRTMDLLWFPTGGGKTEAYLGLVALVGFYRRLTTPSDGGGVAALMRYTLRLLTTQQFARSAAMILACEAIRAGKIPSVAAGTLLSCQPFSVGLWVGRDASPNRLALAWASLNGARELSSPKQLAKCPACQQTLSWSQASVTSPVNVSCLTNDCVLSGDLPVWTVDDDVYRERPTLLIGTVDKFAQIVREPSTNALFGLPTKAPPDLIIQDELHLISGPLGTISGVYESAFDLLFSEGGAPPKIIGSTATIRRAPEQIRDLFDRTACQFPPPAINHDDSGFAVRESQSAGRRYVGVTTAGRSAKFTLQAVSASLLQSAFAAFDDEDARDPYWTLVGYFNSLRELGGALVLIQDDVTDSIRSFAGARGEKPRPMNNIEELTSRRTQEEVLRMLDLLAIKVGQPGVLDAVLATNMMSVGVDIGRLGLMVVNGQPKTTAEYIQSTSRVGRGEVAGLVVSILNNAKARDRSHFETFVAWHSTLYRDVEATSVTPFASRARDKALHAALVAAVRHLAPGMLDRPRLNPAARTRAEELIELIVARAARIDGQETDVRRELLARLDRWEARAPQYYWQDYKDGQSLLQSAERAAWKKALGRQAGAAWPTLNSMRAVEAGTPFRMAPVLRRSGVRDEE